MRILLFTVLIVLLSSFSYAAPTITGVISGDFTDGSTITISGMNFGTKAHGPPLRWLDFDDGNVPDELSEPGWYLDNPSSSTWCQPHYSNENMRDGTKNAMLCGQREYPGYDQQGFATGKLNPPDDKLYISGFMRFDWGSVNPPPSPTQIKTWRIYAGDGTSWLTGYPTLIQENTVTNGGGHEIRISQRNTDGSGCLDDGEDIYDDIEPSDVRYSHTEYSDDAWDRFEIIYNIGSQGGLRESPLTGDGSLLHIINNDEQSDTFANYNFYCAGDSKPDNFYLGNYMGNVISSATNQVHYDDIYVDDTWQRIELCDASTKASASNCEMQIPQTWTDNSGLSSITAEVNLGTFVGDEDLYLFVFDENNVASPGYPVSSSVNLIASQDFEQSGWESEFTGFSSWGDNIVRTSSDCVEGSYCLRWNQDSSRVDPITGLQGIGNSLLDWRGGTDIVSQTPNEMFYRMWFRHDDYNNDAGYSNSARKLFYVVDDVYNVGGMYVKFQAGTTDLQISYSNGAYSDQWARDNWGYDGMTMSNPSSLPSTDGVWRLIEMYWNYDEHYVQMWLDGNLLIPQRPSYSSNYPVEAAAGKVLWDPNLDLHTKGFQIMYFDAARDLVNGADETGYAVGVQIDALEVWDGIPGSVTVPVPCSSRSTFNTPCSLGVGECNADGVYACNDPDSLTELPSCDAVAGTPVAEECGNGLDEDCDGVLDNGCPVTELIIDDGDAGTSDDGSWNIGGYSGGYNDDYEYSPNEAGHWYEWQASNLDPGMYEVYAYWQNVSGRPTNAEYEITHSLGTSSVFVDQEVDGGQWNLLGTYDLGSSASVRLVSGVSSEGACADAVRFLRVGVPVCSDGEITSVCVCAGVERSGGFCCSGSYSRDPCVAPPPVSEFDLDGDADVDFDDLFELASNYGASTFVNDFSGDGRINILDLLMLINNFT